MTPPARVAYFSLPVAGHVAPVLPVLRELLRDGAQLRVYSGTATAAALGSTGAHVVPYPPQLDDAARSLSANFIEVAATLASLTETTMLPFALAALAAERPDVVVVDSMAPWGRLAAEQLKLPVVTLSTSFVVHAGLGGGLRPALDVARRARTSARALLSIVRVRRSLRLAGFPDCGGPLRLLSNRGDATIAFTSAQLQPGARRLGPAVHFVGATLDEDEQVGSREDRELLALLDERGEQELVYVALGTIYNDRPDFYRACIAALARPGRLVLLSVGERIAPDRLGPLPAGVLVRSRVPQPSVLRRAALFVSHGGMNSVNEALWHGVPLLLFPQAADQPVVADRMRRLGCGEVLTGREPDASQIARRAAAVLAGPASRRAAVMGSTLRIGPGAAGAAALILRA